MNVPKWVFPLVRVIGAILAIAIGAAGWADGFGMYLIPIASTIIVAEIVGAHVATEGQAAEFVQALIPIIEGIVRRYIPPPASPPPTGGPPGP